MIATSRCRCLLATCLFAIFAFQVDEGRLLADPLSDADAAFAKKNYAVAMGIWRPLADGGDAVAEFKLGMMYQLGNGVVQDYAAAVQWLGKSARQDNAEAETILANDFHTGDGVAQDPSQEVYWNSKAAEHGFPPAQAALGMSYQRGLGVRHDDVLAYKWLKLAENASGNPRLPAHWRRLGLIVGKTAQLVREQLVVPEMTEQQISRADQLVATFREH